MKQTLRSYLSDPLGKRLLILLMLGAILSIGIGLALSPSDFLGNLLAEIAGAAASIVLGLLVIDWYLEYRRKQDWSKTEGFTLKAITTHLCEIAGNTFICFPGLSFDAVDAIFGGHGKLPNPETSQCFRELLKELQSYELPTPVSSKMSESDLTIDYYEGVKWDLDQIQIVLTPRVMASPVDQTLIDLLVEFDDSQRELRHSIIAHQQICPQDAFLSLVDLIECAGRLYQAMYEHLRTDAA